MKRMSILAIGFVVGCGACLAGCQMTRGGYASAPYKVVRAAGRFELRDYPSLAVVETSSCSGQANAGFVRLFRYISGANDIGEKISMTTPVLMTGSSPGATMAFVLPTGMRSVPRPTDGSVVVRNLPAGRFAVLKFGGSRSVRHEAESLERLKSWVFSQRLPILSEPIFGYFDPPWTPGIFRRNEVMVRTTD